MFSLIQRGLQSSVQIRSNIWNTQLRCMSKFLSRAAKKRVPLNAKFAGKGFYKGKGGTKEGTFSGRAGRFVIEKERLLELLVPDLTNFKLKPYIASTVPKWAPEARR